MQQPASAAADPADLRVGTVMPKILHVVLSLAVGGAEKLVNDMVRHPAFAGNPPVVCCLDELGELGEHLRQDGYTVHVRHRRSGIDWSVIGWLREIMVREGIGVVHAHQYTPLFYTVPAALLAGRLKVVYTEHGRFYPDRKSWKRALFNPILSLGVAHLVAISRATAQAMAEFDNLPQRRIQVIHNGIDCSALNPPVDLAAKRRELGLSDTCRIVGTASRLDTIKNIPMMLAVMKQVVTSNPDAILLIAGQGPVEAELKAQAAELGIENQVRFLGLRFDMAELYRLFDLFVLTSFSEGISITLLEAMATGVPPVVTDVGGNREIIVPGTNGFLVPLGNNDDMAQAVRALLEQSELAARIGQAAQKHVFTHFTAQRMVDTYCTLYAN